MLNPVSVKTLAEFVHRRGDLYPALGGRVTGEEGIATQRRVQQGREGGYQREVTVAEAFARSMGCRFRCPAGWMAATSALSCPSLRRSKPPGPIRQTAERAVGSAHWAQARLYAALLAREHPEHPVWQVRLLYCHPDTDAQQRFEEDTFRGLAARLPAGHPGKLRQLARAEQAYQNERNRWLDSTRVSLRRVPRPSAGAGGRVYQAFRMASICCWKRLPAAARPWACFIPR